jgi:F-type H+-transporting ATPase subunit delta
VRRTNKMKESDIYAGKLYAAALFELAEKADAMNDIWQDLSAVKQLIADEKEFLNVYISPYFPLQFKSQLLRELFAGKVGDLTLNFLQVVNKHNRMRCLSLIAEDYEMLLDEHFGRARIAVTLTKEPDRQEIQNLAAEIGSALGSEVKLSVKIDPSIIGGIIIRKGDAIIDNSIKTQLHQAVRAITSRRKNREKIHEI